MPSDERLSKDWNNHREFVKWLCKVTQGDGDNYHINWEMFYFNGGDRGKIEPISRNI